MRACNVPRRLDRLTKYTSTLSISGSVDLLMDVGSTQKSILSNTHECAPYQAHSEHKPDNTAVRHLPTLVEDNDSDSEDELPPLIARDGYDSDDDDDDDEDHHSRFEGNFDTRIYTRPDYQSMSRSIEHLPSRIAKNRIWRFRNSYRELRIQNTKLHLPVLLEESLGPQFGVESFTAANFALDALSRFAGIDLPEATYREIEGLVLVLTNLSQQTTAAGVISSILLYLQGRTSKSLFLTLKEYITEILMSPQSSEDPSWLSCLRNVSENWQLSKNNRAFKQISKLLGLLVIMGLCDASDVTFNLKQFKLLAPDMMDKHTNAFDLADAIFETVIFFTEGMYLCFKTGSIRPLLMNNRAAVGLDEEYACLIAWWELVKNGNLKKFTNMEDHDFETRLNALSSSLKNVSISLKGLDKKLVMDKFTRILSIQNDFVSRKIACGLRHSPFAFECFGDSAQGKTTFGAQLTDALLASQGMNTSNSVKCAYNAGDKYMSNWTSDKTVLVFDDMCNEKSKFVERPPTRAIIDVCNNQMYYAPKAELESKGRCFVEPWIVYATTNVKDLDARLYSNAPYTVQRRLVCITVKAKPEFQLIRKGIPCGIDTNKVVAFYSDENGVYHPPAFDDIWILTVEEAVQPEDISLTATYDPVVYRGQELIDISMELCVQWACEAFADHRVKQSNILLAAKAREGTVMKCPHDKCCHIQGHCPDHLDSQFGKESVKAIKRLGNKFQNMFLPDPAGLADRVDEKASELLYDYGTKYLNQWDWIKLVPTSVLETKWCHDLLAWAYKEKLEEDAFATSRSLWTQTMISVILCLCFPYGAFFACLFVIYAILYQRRIVVVVEEQLFEELKDKNVQLAPMFKRYREDYANILCKSAFAVAAVYGLARAYRAYKDSVRHTGLNAALQGSLEPKTQEEIDQRDKEVNVWTSVIQRELPISDHSKRADASHIANKVRKNLVYASIHLPDGETGRVNGLMLSTNVVLIPDHYFLEFGDILDCTFRKENPESCAGKFAARIDKYASVLLKHSDIRCCYTPNGGSFADIVSHFPVGDMPSVPFSLLWRGKDGNIITGKGVTKPGICTTDRDFNGGRYLNFTMNTFGGLCGAPVISETKGSVILGIHLGGTEGTPEGCYGSITQQQLFHAFGELRKVPGVKLAGSSGNFRTTVLGVQVTKPDPLHKKSPLRFMPENSQVEYLGSVTGRTTFKSDVRITPISPHIIDVCGVPNIYRAPKANPEWFGWQTCLENLAVPALPYPHRLLAVAVEDYKEDLLPIFRNKLWNSARPLTYKEAICGMKGVKFIDQLKLNTSIGYPLSGPKRNFVTELDPTEDFPNNRELDPVIMEEIEYVLSEYRQGRRCYCVANACKKDEILSKDKMRIFYGNSVIIVVIMRIYFLQLLRVLQMNPLTSECAVGINAHSPEWDQFVKHAVKFGEDRLIGGDYGKYDQKLPAQVIIAAMSILIDLARECDYSEEDLTIMETMIADVVYAYINFNGDLIGLTEGTHISGNSLTVIINGICGSLNLRAAFYTMNPPKSFETRMKFRDHVALMTYGDDNIGSVKEGCDNFTIKSCSKFLEEYGQTYTMPDKESELLDYLPIEEFEFLKRFSVHHPKLGCEVGALLDKSIYKSLHAFLRPKGCPLTEDQACAMNIDTGLREWFNHGEDKYEKQRVLMTTVAERAGISHMCTRLNMSYNDSVLEWHEKYADQL